MTKKRKQQQQSNKSENGDSRRRRKKRAVQFSERVEQREFVVVQKSGSNDNEERRKKDNDIDGDDDDMFDPTTTIEGAVDNDEEDIPSERKTLQAKRARRLKGMDDDTELERTRINEETSLAHDNEQKDIPIEAFHMKDEENGGGGYFDGDTYIFRRGKEEDDDGGEPDAWLDSLREQQKQQQQQSGDGEFSTVTATVKKSSVTIQRANGVTPMDGLTKEELYAKLIPLVSDSETILQALTRYGNLLKKQRPQNKRQKKQHQQQNDHDDTPRIRAQESLNQITEATNALLFQGELDIYQQTRATILTKLQPQEEEEEEKPQSKNGGNAAQHKRVVQWEYQGNQDGQIHGPYSTSDMLGWTQSGYFIGEQAVQIRTIENRIIQNKMEETATKKSTQDELLDDLMDDEDDDNNDKGGGNETTRTTVEEIVKGEWQSSNDVDFTKYG